MKTSARTTSGSEEHVARVFVGIGANIGDPRAMLDQAQLALRALARPGSFRASSLYRTAPIDAGGPDFLNAVATFETPLAPHALLAALHAIEARHGRQRPYRNAPRTLDLDLLLYGVDAAGSGGVTIADDRLVVPHPRAHLRAFVLEPLGELWLRGTIPGHGAVAGLKQAVRAAGDQRIERLPPRETRRPYRGQASGLTPAFECEGQAEARPPWGAGRRPTPGREGPGSAGPEPAGPLGGAEAAKKSRSDFPP